MTMQMVHRVGLGLCVMWLAWGSGELLAEELRDPFMFGPREEISQTAQPVLNGILWDARSPLAVIDGEPVAVGQAVAGWQVVTIQPDSIVIERDSRRQTILPGSPLPTD